jgi:hypothetical protein
MVGSVNARTLDYFALLVGAGIVALFSALDSIRKPPD